MLMVLFTEVNFSIMGKNLLRQEKEQFFKMKKQGEVMIYEKKMLK